MVYQNQEMDRCKVIDIERCLSQNVLTVLFYFVFVMSYFQLLMIRVVYFDSLVQDCSNSIANALELLQSCTKPSICRYEPQPHNAQHRRMRV